MHFSFQQRRRATRQLLQTNPLAISYLKKCDWLGWTAVYWAGGAASDERTMLSSVLQRKLLDLAPGTYFVQSSPAKGIIALLRPDAKNLSCAAYHLALAEKARAPSEVIEERRKTLSLIGKWLREPTTGARSAFLEIAWYFGGQRVISPGVFRWEIDGLGASEALFHYLLKSAHPEPETFANSLKILYAECRQRALDDEDQQCLAYHAADIAALIGNERVPLRIAEWVRTCAISPALRKPARRHALVSLNKWIEKGSWTPIRLKRLLQLLERCGSAIARCRWNENVPALLELADADALAVLENDMMGVAPRFAGKATRFAMLLNVAVRKTSVWNVATKTDRSLWVDLYRSVREGDLLAKLSQWFCRRYESVHSLSVGTRPERRLRAASEITGLMTRVLLFLQGGGFSDQAMRETFLEKHFHLLDMVSRESEELAKEYAVFGEADVRCAAWQECFRMVKLCYHWFRAGFSGVSEMESFLLQWVQGKCREEIRRYSRLTLSYLEGVERDCVLLVGLSAGDPKLVVKLMQVRREDWRRDDPCSGWKFLVSYPIIIRFLQEVCRDVSKFRLVANLLSRVARMLRLQGVLYLRRRFQEWGEIESERNPLQRLSGFRRMAGLTTPLPASLQRILGRKDSLRRECVALTERRAIGNLSRTGAIRLEHLSQLLNDPVAVAEWIEHDTSRLLAKLLPRIKWELLEKISSDDGYVRWDAFKPDAAESHDWDNALRFFHEVDGNRSLMRKVLYCSRDDTRDWRLDYPSNVRFLSVLKSRGIDSEAWLAEYTETLNVAGQTWQLTVERDPLKILQMGNLFGTCLSVGHCNAFSAIANAVELNKQVLYLTDENGTTIGRKLIALTQYGELVGFRSYGAAALDGLWRMESRRVWIKHFFDRACLRLARRAGGKLAGLLRDGEVDSLRLGARWYNDGQEEFDWWMVRPKLTQAVWDNEQETVALAVLEYLAQEVRFQEGRGFERLATLRALLWLEEEAVTVLENLPPAFFSGNARHFLWLHSRSERVRELVRP